MVTAGFAVTLRFVGWPRDEANLGIIGAILAGLGFVGSVSLGHLGEKKGYVIERYTKYIAVPSYALSFLQNTHTTGPRLNMKTVFTRYGDSHVKDISYTRVYETSTGCPISIYPSLGMRQLFGNVTMGRWRHN